MRAIKTGVMMIAILLFQTCGEAGRTGNEIAESAVVPCKVRDPDIVGSYVGDCLEGFAHGVGKAVGRDFYSGEFENGEPHGRGIYTWGAQSDWAGDIYEGEWLNGSRTGQGLYKAASGVENEGQFLNGQFRGFVEVRIPRRETIGVSLTPEGEWRGDTFVYAGFWRDDSLQFFCKSDADCAEKWDAQVEDSRRVEEESRRMAEESTREAERQRKALSDVLRRRQADQERQCRADKEVCRVTCGTDEYCAYRCSTIQCN